MLSAPPPSSSPRSTLRSEYTFFINQKLGYSRPLMPRCACYHGCRDVPWRRLLFSGTEHSGNGSNRKVDAEQGSPRSPVIITAQACLGPAISLSPDTLLS